MVVTWKKEIKKGILVTLAAKIKHASVIESPTDMYNVSQLLLFENIV